MNKKKADSIITEYLQKIYGFAVKKSFSYDEAEELAAEIVKNVYTTLLKSEEIYNIEGYIWRISEHTYSRYVTQKKKHMGVSIDGMQIPYYEDFLCEDGNEDILLLRREIAFLTEKRRKIVYMFYYLNKSVSFISNELCMPEGTVKWHLNKARNELKEGYTMERKIGKLGLSPITAIRIGHSGSPGQNGGPEYYIEDKINLNIVYSVYFEPKTKNEIAEELGLTPVYIEDRIAMLEVNGFLIPIANGKYTTYVRFEPRIYSQERMDKITAKQHEIAEILVKEYVPSVRKAISDMRDKVYIPDGNFELFEAAVIFNAVGNNCRLNNKNDISKYYIKTTDGGRYIATVELECTCNDPDYTKEYNERDYWSCGDMLRDTNKYPVRAWSVDTKYTSRVGTWKNNLYTDYEYLYEHISGMIKDDIANADKYKRLREKQFIDENNNPNIIIYKGTIEELFDSLPRPDSKIIEQFAGFALDAATQRAKDYPSQMQDLVINWSVGGFISNTVAIMVMDILYNNGTFKQLTDNEKVTSNLIMFCDQLPE